MKLEQLTLPIKNTMLKQYWANDETVASFFHYRVEQSAYAQRLTYLQTKQYKRQQLAEVIESYMRPYGISTKAATYIAQLKDDAVVVVGGQQAGILTGPMYSVNKAISVLVLAQQQAAALQHPVVPLFWIAGEDHDIEEINHTFTIVQGEPKKRSYRERSVKKTMASATPIQHEQMAQTIRDIFADYGETAYTAQLLEDVLATLAESDTFTAFFTALMHKLFSEHGLLMLDAAYEPFRAMQAPYFEQLIVHNETIAQRVVETEQKLAAAGYGTPIEATVQNANLFYVRDGERFLLTRENAQFSHANAGVRFSEQQLLHIAQTAPHELSNNVVTRPLMQEMTIPVLAFVGGPGELAYWATLKQAFETLQLQMPIFTPRMSVTVVNRQVQPLLAQEQLTFEDVYANEVAVRQQAFIDSLQDEALQQELARTQQQLQAQYAAIAAQLEQLALPLEKILAKNLQFHEQQLAFLQTKIDAQLLQKHDVAIRQFMLLQAELLPNGGFQERLYSPYQYMNSYGPTFVDDLLAQQFTINAAHNIVYL